MSAACRVAERHDLAAQHRRAVSCEPGALAAISAAKRGNSVLLTPRKKWLGARSGICVRSSAVMRGVGQRDGGQQGQPGAERDRHGLRQPRRAGDIGQRQRQFGPSRARQDARQYAESHSRARQTARMCRRSRPAPWRRCAAPATGRSPSPTSTTALSDGARRRRRAAASPARRSTSSRSNSPARIWRARPSGQRMKISAISSP